MRYFIVTLYAEAVTKNSYLLLAIFQQRYSLQGIIEGYLCCIIEVLRISLLPVLDNYISIT